MLQIFVEHAGVPQEAPNLVYSIMEGVRARVDNEGTIEPALHLRLHATIRFFPDSLETVSSHGVSRLPGRDYENPVIGQAVFRNPEPEAPAANAPPLLENPTNIGSSPQPLVSSKAFAHPIRTASSDLLRDDA